MLDFLAGDVKPELLVERILVAGFQTLGRLFKSRADLLLRDQSPDRDIEVANRPFGLGVAAGEGKADSAGTGRLPWGKADSSLLQYGNKLILIKRLA